jgi:hypothetical protein
LLAEPEFHVDWLPPERQREVQWVQAQRHMAEMLVPAQGVASVQKATAAAAQVAA